MTHLRKINIVGIYDEPGPVQYELRLSWDNDRHHGFRMRSLSPDDVAQAFESAHHLILREVDARKL